MKKRKSSKKSKAEQSFKDLEVVLIHWEDASYQRGELRTEDINPKCILQTVGFLIKQSKKHITTAMDWDEGEKTWRHISNIPTKLIISIVILQSGGCNE